MLQFKVISTQLRKNLNYRFSIPADGLLQDLYKEFGVLLTKRFMNQLDEIQLSQLLQGYKLRNGRGGQQIFASEFEAFEYFCGGDAVLDMEVDEQFVGLQW